ncbi:50S ribosomal protein L25/general stress protein Ctc [Agromyces atrinae]|uniref:50S ribosomal protein L25/general stress protein Ctc n=1 Tax=Agromyces atrinae TaxID=592376 RepID=UPI001F58A914|nr:50S ribosomal protein L25/general stress protein Ctc [Agromyces atrinae]MCI2959347.1 50S ribosomal protein L25/general stress protein Ctc [Agromyces atrinae]
MADNSNNHLVAEARETFGKGAARKIRAIGKIPAVIYGHGTEPQHVTLPGHETALILRKSNQVLELDIAGKTELALVKDVQKDPVRQIIEHIDLIVIKKGEKVQVEVPVHLVGETFSGTTVDQDLHVLKLEVEATHIPENVEVNVEGLTEGSHVYAKDVVLPKGAALIDEPEALILTVYVPTGNAADEAADEAVAAAASAESAAEAAE